LLSEWLIHAAGSEIAVGVIKRCTTFVMAFDIHQLPYVHDYWD